MGQVFVSGRVLRRFGTLLSCAILLLGPAEGVTGEIKCWKNNDGFRECGQVVPPEYSQKRIEVINERGITVRVIEGAKTPEQLAEDARLAEEKKRQQEQRQYDRNLLITYTKDEDIEAARDKKINALQLSIDLTAGNAKVLERKLNKLRQQAADYERSAKPVPQQLLDDIAELKRQLNNKAKFIVDKEQEIVRLKKQYASDLARFRELKQRIRPR